MQYYEDLALRIFGEEPTPLFGESYGEPEPQELEPISFGADEAPPTSDQLFELPEITPVEISQTAMTTEASLPGVAQGRPRRQRLDLGFAEFEAEVREKHLAHLDKARRNAKEPKLERPDVRIKGYLRDFRHFFWQTALKVFDNTRSHWNQASEF